MAQSLTAFKNWLITFCLAAVAVVGSVLDLVLSACGAPAPRGPLQLSGVHQFSFGGKMPAYDFYPICTVASINNCSLDFRCRKQACILADLVSVHPLSMFKQGREPESGGCLLQAAPCSWGRTTLQPCWNWQSFIPLPSHCYLPRVKDTWGKKLN